jgi:hypothetical protein
MLQNIPGVGRSAALCYRDICSGLRGKEPGGEETKKLERERERVDRETGHASLPRSLLTICPIGIYLCCPDNGRKRIRRIPSEDTFHSGNRFYLQTAGTIRLTYVY